MDDDLSLFLPTLPEPGDVDFMPAFIASTEVAASAVHFLTGGGDPWEVLAGERAWLGQEITSLEVARDLLALI